ncbi:4-hydroxy-3-methylbut-2-enyl diphosphate reductase [Pilibacter termitis]|uniref:4-hydroxy-3-methylbut-2-enyl diphosphate reductase n=1 Tax=Pilibacter termitis TaxID=263852 RepID=A0A1T4LF76_9ENTE|nr:4-hydroxy-3-methylbut-2-enyl diphosphate reductase [Pilibacter termitis]SJZ53124.1 4-hydroxy-3-methylbut-2-enyl diphosphate reductase [Pilibacter termitis]
MEIINISPRGYCYGVVDAMVIARNAALDETLPRPIYILGMIVHNAHVTKSFEDIGVQTVDGENRLEILEKIERGTVIFTAHGIAPEVVERAKEKGLTTIDATCPDVQITHELIAEKVAKGFDVLYIGKKGHPEPEGAIGIAPKKVHLIASLADIEKLNLSNPKLFVTNQTTMSQWDVADLMAEIQLRYPQVILHKDICLATQVRQEAVVEQAKGCDLTLVVGDPRSNNSNRLAQVSIEQAKVAAYRISDVSQIHSDWLFGIKKIAVTAGASTPTPVVREVIEFLEQFDEENPATWQGKSRVTSEDILPRARKRDLTKKREGILEKLREQQLR